MAGKLGAINFFSGILLLGLDVGLALITSWATRFAVIYSGYFDSGINFYAFADSSRQDKRGWIRFLG